ncbi:hypothetical protein TCON_2402 [Astathelohania contejeani]|uniref:Uncharacterized protein n=1 Tax=Astathelohania contejeani TaxID=164912 RepID=A0ABQ7HW33_9MICR|nr:hypothetical protein TCON_2402 [Thelohania contejeani]
MNIRNTLNTTANMKILYYYIACMLEITSFAIAIYFTNRFESAYTFMSNFMGIFLGNLFITEAIISNNIYQMYMYLYIISFNLVASLVRGFNLSQGVVFASKLIFVILIVQRFIVSMIFLYYISPYAKWNYYKKLGANEAITSK